MLYFAICSGITLHTASFSFNSGARTRSSWGSEEEEEELEVRVRRKWKGKNSNSVKKEKEQWDIQQKVKGKQRGSECDSMLMYFVNNATLMVHDKRHLEACLSEPVVVALVWRHWDPCTLTTEAEKVAGD